MARYMFPNGEDRLIYQTGLSPGSTILNANGTKILVYTDKACTTLANILNEDGSVNAASSLTVDGQSQLPLFQGPDGVDTLYLRPENTNGDGYRVHARYEDTKYGLDSTRIDITDGTGEVDLSITSAQYGVITTKNETNPGIANAIVGRILMNGRDTAGNAHNYAEIRGIVTDPTDGSEDGYLRFFTQNNGVFAESFRVGFSSIANVLAFALSTDARAFVARGAAGQTAPVLEVQTSAGEPTFSVSVEGTVKERRPDYTRDFLFGGAL